MKLNRVEIRAEEVPLPSWTKKAESFVQKVLSSLGHKNWDLSVLFCDNRYIKSLNAKYRDKDEATDVLSFPIGEKSKSGRFIAGDIVLSLDALEENSKYFRITTDEELRRLLIHAILHLSGGEHGNNKAKEPMIKNQEEILDRLKGETIIPKPANGEQK